MWGILASGKCPTIVIISGVYHLRSTMLKPLLVLPEKTAELEKKPEDMTMKCSRMEYLLMQLMASQFSIDSFEINEYIFQMAFCSKTKLINRQNNQEK